MATTIQRLMDWREDNMADDTINPDTTGLIWDYYDEQTAIPVIASLVGVDIEVVEMVIDNGRREFYCPTVEQIKAECREIQKGWTRKERRRRQVQQPTRWMPRLCKVLEGDHDE